MKIYQHITKEQANSGKRTFCLAQGQKKEIQSENKHIFFFRDGKIPNQSVHPNVLRTALGLLFHSNTHFFFKQHLFLQFWRRVVQIQGVCKAMLPLKLTAGPLPIWSSGLLAICALPWLIEVESLPLLSHDVLPYVSQSHLGRELCLFFIITIFYLQKN